MSERTTYWQFWGAMIDCRNLETPARRNLPSHYVNLLDLLCSMILQIPKVRHRIALETRIMDVLFDISRKTT